MTGESPDSTWTQRGRFQRLFEKMYPFEAGKQLFSCLFSDTLGVFEALLNICTPV